MKKLLTITLFVCMISGFNCSTKFSKEPSGEWYDWTKTMQPEKPWTRDYTKTLVLKLGLCKRDGNDNPLVNYTFAQALEEIKKYDLVTQGMPKIVYLGGWQFNGHDSQYPAWSKVNEALKRPEDKTAVESLRWLMREARKYNTWVSLHINMIAAYRNSPLWNTYLKNDIIAKNVDGSFNLGQIQSGMQVYYISYTQEWVKGYAQKRIDDLVKMLPELKESGTIHIDAYHTFRKNTNTPYSPYLKWSIDDDEATQRKVFRYWRDKYGIDVTCEGSMDDSRKDPFIGLQAGAWHFNTDKWIKKDFKGKPEEGVDYPLPPHLYSFTPITVKRSFWDDPKSEPDFIEKFCRAVVPWYYLYYQDISPKNYLFEKEVFTPVLWLKETLVAYNVNGYKNQVKQLPKEWGDVKSVKISKITYDGLKDTYELYTNDDGTLTLSLKPKTGVYISADKKW